jgi:hypothetical protein
MRGMLRLLKQLKQISPEMDAKLGKGLSAELVKFLDTLDYLPCENIDEEDRKDADDLFV